jgi:amino acid adenylation domain-containing protein
LVEIWRDLLGRREIGVEDDFFSLGGHSLLATRLVAGIRETFRVHMPLRRLFETPTVAGLARWIVEQRREEPAAAELPPLDPIPEHRFEPFPMTEIQQAYWIGRSGAFELGNVATHSYTELESSELDLDRFELAWRRLVQRHDMLRAVMLPDGRQRVLPQVPEYEVRALDLRERPEDEVEQALAQVREELSHQVLDPETWPLFDVRISLLPGDRKRLHVSRDALIYDAWSASLLLREIAELYRDPDVALEPLEITFRDYVLAERALRETGIYARALAYWQERLTSLPPAPELPLVRRSATEAQPRFVRRQGSLEEALWSRLRERASREGLTPSTVLLAAYAEVLGAFSKKPRFTLNLTLFQRLPFHSQVDLLVGDFTSLTLLEVEIRPRESLTQRARRLQARLWEDLDHRWVGGVRVLRELARRRGGKAGAAMPVVFTSTLGFGRVEPAPADLGRLVYSITQTPQVWLDHQVAEIDGELVFNWDAVEELFPAGMLDAMFDAYGEILRELAGGAAAWEATVRNRVPVRQLAAREAVNATAAPLPEGLLHSPFVEQAARCPEAAAVIAGPRRMSYGELDRLSNRLAHRLRRRRVAPDRLVAVVLEKGWRQVVAVLGILKAGAAYLPIDPALPRQRLHHLLAHGEVAVALTQADLVAALEWPPDVVVEAVEETALAMEEATPAVPAQGPGDLAYVIFTSGSTGLPKGVMIEHRSALNTVVDVNRRFAVAAEDRVLSVSALGFDLSVYDVFGPLSVGAALVIPEPSALRDPARLQELMEHHRVTLWNSVPALMEMLVGYAESSGKTLAESLRWVLLSGDWIAVDLPDRVRALRPQAEVVSLGGATEASIWSVLYPIGEVPASWTSIPYGRPMVNQRLHVLDDALEPRPLWVPGELYIAGEGLARGYWRDEEKTRRSFLFHPRTGERLYRTGDLARYLPSGDLEFLGREDLQVKVQGYRIELGEIEAVLAQHPAVRQVVASAVGEPRGPRRLLAHVVAHEGREIAAESLRSFAAGKLPAYMVPAAFLELAALPLTANGKVDRKALAESATPPDQVPPPAADRTATAHRIAGLIAEVLNAGEIDPESDLDRQSVRAGARIPAPDRRDLPESDRRRARRIVRALAPLDGRGADPGATRRPRRDLVGGIADRRACAARCFQETAARAASGGAARGPARARQDRGRRDAAPGLPAAPQRTAVQPASNSRRELQPFSGLSAPAPSRRRAQGPVPVGRGALSVAGLPARQARPGRGRRRRNLLLRPGGSSVGDPRRRCRP